MGLFTSKEEKDRIARKQREERTIAENNISHPNADDYAKKAREVFIDIETHIPRSVTMSDSASIKNFINYMTNKHLSSSWRYSVYDFYTLKEEERDNNIFYSHTAKQTSLLTIDEQKRFLSVLLKIFDKLRLELTDKKIVLKSDYKSEINTLLNKIIYTLKQDNNKMGELYTTYNKIVDFEKKLQTDLSSENNTFSIAGQAKQLFSMKRTGNEIPELQKDILLLNTLSNNVEMMIKIFEFMVATDQINPDAYAALLYDLTKAIKEKKSYAFYSIKQINNVLYLTSNDNKEKIEIDLNNFNYSRNGRESLTDIERLIEIVHSFDEKIQKVECVQSDDDCRNFIESLCGSGILSHNRLFYESEDEQRRLKSIKESLAILLSSLTQDRLLDTEITSCGKSIRVSMLKLMDEIQKGNARRKLGGIADTVIAPAVKHIIALDDALEKSISSLKPSIITLGAFNDNSYGPAQKTMIQITLSTVANMEKHAVLEKNIEGEINTLLTNISTWMTENQGKNITRIFREKGPKGTVQAKFMMDLGQLMKEFERFEELHKGMNRSLEDLSNISKGNHTAVLELKDQLQRELDKLTSLRTLSKDILATLFKITNDLKESVNAMRAPVK